MSALREDQVKLAQSGRAGRPSAYVCSMIPTATIGGLLAGIFGAGASADITLLGTAAIRGDALDKSGLTGSVGKDIPAARLGSFGSAIDYTGKGNLYIACDDRGPGNGEVPFRPRFHTLRIAIDPTQSQSVKVDLVSTTLLSNERGEALNGFAAAFSEKTPELSARFDPEGLRLSANGTLFISDEYGPWIDEFATSGTRLRRLAIPSKFGVLHSNGDPDEEDASNTHGRQSNRGFEGLAMSPDKSKLWAIVQGPLIQDGAFSTDHKRVGRNCRMLEIPIAGGPTREYVYPLDSHKTGLNEALAINDHEFLVIERDGGASKERCLYRIDIAGATDVSAIGGLPSTTLPDSIKPVSKQRWLDFTDPKYGLSGDKMPEKIEGLTFGPGLPDGRRTLIVTTDNDLRADQPSWFWVFAFDPNDLISAAVSPHAVSMPATRESSARP